MTGFKRIANTLCVSVMALTIAACATPANRAAMTVASVPTAKKFQSSASVHVTGGADAAANQGPTIGNEELKAAIEDSIKNSKLFKTVAQGRGGDYELNVFITKIDRPLGGFSMTVNMEAGWSVTRVLDKSVVLRKVIDSSYTATMSDSVAGHTRIRLAVEGAARNNINKGLEAVSALDL